MEIDFPSRRTVPRSCLLAILQMKRASSTMWLSIPYTIWSWNVILGNLKYSDKNSVPSIQNFPLISLSLVNHENVLFRNLVPRIERCDSSLKQSTRLQVENAITRVSMPERICNSNTSYVIFFMAQFYNDSTHRHRYNLIIHPLSSSTLDCTLSFFPSALWNPLV